MQALRFILFSFITFTIISNAQTVIPPGDVSGTWTLSGSPYEIQGEINIPFLETLTIEPGVLVEFQGHYKLNVQGRLLAVGTETDTIVFTINDTTGFHILNVPDGGWHGIRFMGTPAMNDSSKIIYCKLQYGKAIGSGTDHSGGAICVSGFDKLTIENCLITNNIASGIDWPAGGGIALWTSSPVLIGNTISNNSAYEGGGVEFYESNATVMNNIFINNLASAGGGLIIKDNSNIVLINDSIANNVADNGGGIISWGSSIIIMENVDLVENTALLYSGGGVNIFEGGSLTMNNCNFINNESLNGLGGGIQAGSCDLQIDNCSFVENEAPNGMGGGAIGCTYWDAYSTFLVTITNTIFDNNYTNEWGGGVAVWSADTLKFVDVLIDNCEFINNTAGYYAGLYINNKGVNFNVSNCKIIGNEAVNFGGGSGFNGSDGIVSNCLFASNVACTGGGNWNSGGVGVWWEANVDFMNCTFADNSSSYGAGLAVGMGATATTTNCIFWGNSSNQIALDTMANQGGTLTVNYCDVQGGENSVNVIDPSLSTLNWGDGNINEDPLFVNSGNAEYDLQDSSTCINAAIDAIEINGIMCYCPIYDIEGNPRPNPAGSMPDMGAYESPEGIVSVEENETGQPTEYALYQNYPNPFNPTTTIQYSIPELSNVTLKVYDVLGSEVITLVNEEKPVGSYEVGFDGVGLPSGIYFYRLQSGSFVETKKMVLMK
jgi:hypothetical protein